MIGALRYLCIMCKTYLGWKRHSSTCAFVNILEEYTGPSITSILGRLKRVPVGDNGTILFWNHPIHHVLLMCKETDDIPGASCDSKMGAGVCKRWWYTKSTAMNWHEVGNTPITFPQTCDLMIHIFKMQPNTRLTLVERYFNAALGNRTRRILLISELRCSNFV